METPEDGIESIHKENVDKQNKIESYFDFSNRKWKKRHSILLIFEIFNFPVIVTILFLGTFANIWKYTLISVFTLIFIISIILFMYKKISYRYLNFTLVFFGSLFVMYILYLSKIAQREIFFESINIVSNSFEKIVLGVILFVDIIFLLNYLTIEFSKKRHFKPQTYKMKNRIFQD